MYLSIFVFLLIIAIGVLGYFLYAGKKDEIEVANSLSEKQLQLVIEDNELISEKISETDEKIERYRQDDRYEELALWKRLREQLKSQLSS